MTILNDLEHLHARRAAMAAGGACGRGQVLRVLYEDWDIWPTSGRTDRFGMARTPHIAILRGVDVSQAGHRAVLSLDMDQRAMEAGIWRQLMILPNGPIAAADPFEPPVGRTIRQRECFIREMTGHSPQDFAEFIDDLKRHDEPLARLILAKDIKAALRRRPDLFDMPWPSVTLERWKRTGGRDYLPPAVFAGVLPELARLAQNISAHVHLTYDEKGDEIFSAGYRDALPTLGGPFPAPAAVRRLAEMTLLSSTALVPPDDILNTIRLDRCVEWSDAAGAVVALELGRSGEAAIAVFREPKDPEAATFNRDGIMRNPRFGPEHHHTGSPWLQKGNPATFRGMTCRQHAATGLLSLAAEVRALSAHYRTGRNRLRAPVVNRELERALAAIFYLWIEASHPTALRTALAPVIAAKRGALKVTLSAEDQSIDALALGERFGKKWCQENRLILSRAPLPGEKGYTAGYHIHLWFADRGDDIAEYENLQQLAIRRHKKLLRAGNDLIRHGLENAPRAPARSSHISPAIDPRKARRRLRKVLKMRRSKIAPRVIQDCAMMLLPPATDPIHVVNAAPHRWI